VSSNPSTAIEVNVINEVEEKEINSNNAAENVEDRNDDEEELNDDT